MRRPISRRTFSTELLQLSAAMLAAPALMRRVVAAPAVIDGARPIISNGVASGDVSFDSAIVWSRCDRTARMNVEWSTTESFANAQQVRGPVANETTGFTAKLELNNLPAGQRIFYRVRFENEGGSASEPVSGQFLTAPRDTRDVFFAWSGDTCGQGFGIDESRGGLRIYESIRRLRPDFFVHSGDTIYADYPLYPEMKLPDGTTWRNVVTEEKSKVAETLREFRGNHRYNLLDANVRAFNADVPILAQWDDHEVRNNWYPGQKLLEDPRYAVKDVDVLVARARQAFFEYLPLRGGPDSRIYRNLQRGPLCELFFLDLRSYRGPNSPNRQPQRSRETDYMGDEQLGWLKRALAASRSTWKVICCDMPLGILIPDGRAAFENCANGNGPPLGRELEIADLLRFMKQRSIRNVIWLTADVHHAISQYYDPTRAQFTEFDPFWEFVSGPLHAGTYGPNALDNTFGPEVRWNSRKTGDPTAGPHTPHQFFGTVRIDSKTLALTVQHYNRDGLKLSSLELPADLSVRSRG